MRSQCSRETDAGREEEEQRGAAASGSAALRRSLRRVGAAVAGQSRQHPDAGNEPDRGDEEPAEHVRREVGAQDDEGDAHSGGVDRAGEPHSDARRTRRQEQQSKAE